MDINLAISIVISALSCAVLIPLVSAGARRFGLVDKPVGRKQHAGDVPVVGGLSIYFATIIALFSAYLFSSALVPLLVGSALLILGVIDDRVGLRTAIRFPVQAATALVMMAVGGIGIESVGNIAGFGPVLFTGAASVVFTIVCTVGVINSINMIDGVDGLSGTIISITLATLAYFNYLAGDMASVALLLSLLAATLVFLIFYNSRLFRPRAAIFMGDAGSTLFGFVLVWYFIQLTQGEGAVLSPVAAGWIFGLPLLYTVVVMVGRVLDKRSPFDADRNHLHHKLIAAGLSPNQVVASMALVHLMFTIGGILCNQSVALEPVFFWLFVAITVLHFFLTPRLLLSYGIGTNDASSARKKAS